MRIINLKIDEMEEPTFKQHKVLESINEQGGSEYMTGKEDNIELYWELVRGSYLNNLVVMSGIFEWRFVLTEQAETYLETTN